MRLGLFGGTFDPVHNGHLQLARCAAQKFRLNQVLFVPAFVPPHKHGRPTAGFEHRFAMLALATLDEKPFLPSLLEAPRFPAQDAQSLQPPSSLHGVAERGDLLPAPSYSIDTLRRVRRRLKPRDRLFFLIGIDAFLDIGTWKDSVALFEECEFIVGSRPGYTVADVAQALPKEQRRGRAGALNQRASGTIVIGGTRLHLLDDVNVPVSATQVRSAAEHGRPLVRLVPPAVAKYITKMGLYRKQPVRAGGKRVPRA
jgi:nicotinate-nucleotide adenylyltransferase